MGGVIGAVGVSVVLGGVVGVVGVSVVLGGVVGVVGVSVVLGGVVGVVGVVGGVVEGGTIWLMPPISETAENSV